MGDESDLSRLFAGSQGGDAPSVILSMHALSKSKQAIERLPAEFRRARPESAMARSIPSVAVRPGARVARVDLAVHGFGGCYQLGIDAIGHGGETDIVILAVTRTPRQRFVVELEEVAADE